MTRDERYRTVAGTGRSEFVVDGSRFIGHVAPVETVAEAEAVVASIASDHPDATHVIPAYRVRVDGLLREYASDEGEPSGSAGRPARSVLERRDLENCSAVVVRYYGGRNLGVGGLVRAYARAVSEAVDDAGVVTERPHESVVLTVDYDDSGRVRSILESEGIAVDATYEEVVDFSVRIPAGDVENVLERLQSATSGRVTVERPR